MKHVPHFLFKLFFSLLTNRFPNLLRLLKFSFADIVFGVFVFVFVWGVVWRAVRGIVMSEVRFS